MYMSVVSRCVLFFFFFSSRRRHTRCSRDWSSDVCSSDLTTRGLERRRQTSLSMALGARASRVVRQALTESILLSLFGGIAGLAIAFAGTRSEERRVGKECRSRWSPYH